MRNTRTLSLLTGLLLAAMMLAGCGRTIYGKYSYRVSLDAANRDPSTQRMPSIEVDFIAVNESERDRWLALDIDAYFTPGNVLRANADKFTMSFTDQRSQPQELSASDPIWQKWQRAGARSMFILASIPMRGEKPPVDPRRLDLPLDQARWDATKIDVLIKPSGVVRQTPMRPAK